MLALEIHEGRGFTGQPCPTKMKISSGRYGDKSVKFCTSENSPLYGIGNNHREPHVRVLVAFNMQSLL